MKEEDLPDLQHFQDFVRLCKDEGLMQAECGPYKVTLPPPNMRPSKPGEEKLPPNQGPIVGNPYKNLFPGGLPDFPKKPDRKPDGPGAPAVSLQTPVPVINYDELP